MTAHAPAHPSTARRASGVKPLTAGTPPSSRGRKAHNCSPSGGTGGVSPGRAEAHAEDARSALTRRSARSYLRPDIAPSHRAYAVHSRESTSVPIRLSSAAPPLSAEPTGLNPPTPVSGEPNMSVRHYLRAMALHRPYERRLRQSHRTSGLHPRFQQEDRSESQWVSARTMWSLLWVRVRH